jgi:hypothetical protein
MFNLKLQYLLISILLFHGAINHGAFGHEQTFSGHNFAAASAIVLKEMRSPFVQQPAPPAPKLRVDTSSPEFRLGYEVGQNLTKTIAYVIGSLAAIIVVVGLLCTWCRRKPPQPPPLP